MTEQEHNQTPAAPSGGGGGNKPVVVYIMVLFIAAFLLMALSFFMHQRSNTEVMGEIQSSVSAMQELQNSQETIDQLQKELEAAQETAAVFQEANETARNQASLLEHQLERTQEAMDWFWQLNEAYIREDTETCREILETMNSNQESPMSEYLPENSAAAARFQEIQEALDQGAS